MYYANKSTFYVKQYGPAVIISAITLIVVGSGIYMYFKYPSVLGSLFKKNTNIAQTVNNTTTDTSTKKDDTVESNALANEEKTEPIVNKYFETLPALQKSKDVTVTNVSSTGAITVQVDEDKMEITLIGVDFKYSKSSAFDKIKSDLLNKQVKIAFGNLRSENGINYAYVFQGKSLYNAELLKTGEATLKTERKNTELNADLASAQAYARQNLLGVWNK